MSRGARLGVLGAALLVGAALIALVGAPASKTTTGAGGRVAPRFVASTIDSVPRMRSLDDYKGSPLLLNVWATWCDPCREEMPSLEALYQSTRDRGLRIVAVSIDDADQDELIRGFVRENKLTFDILHDATSNIMQQYQVRGVPQTFLITRDGRIMATRFAADWNSASYRALVDSLLSL